MQFGLLCFIYNQIIHKLIFNHFLLVCDQNKAYLCFSVLMQAHYASSLLDNSLNTSLYPCHFGCDTVCSPAISITQPEFCISCSQLVQIRFLVLDSSTLIQSLSTSPISAGTVNLRGVITETFRCLEIAVLLLDF